MDIKVYETYEDFLREKMRKYSTKEILGFWVYEPNFKPDPGSYESFPALVYDKDLYIEIRDDHYNLFLEQEEYESGALHDLEYLLARYKLTCGYAPFIEEYGGPIE